MRILFYVEPVSFKHNHLFMSPLMNVVRCIINANLREDVSYGIASSAGLLREYDRWLAYGGQISVYRKEISEREILRPFEFRLDLYAKSLFGAGDPLELLAGIFSEIDNEFAPDVIVSFTQNALLESMSDRKTILFSERGPVPTWSGVDNFYFDTGGHQAHSILVRKALEIRSFPIEDGVAEKIAEEFRQIHSGIPQRRDAIARIEQWKETSFDGQKIVMIANQPHDSLLVAGTTDNASLENFMMSTLADLPTDWGAFATYHKDMGEVADLDRRLHESFPNFCGLPPELSQFGSDVFADNVDAMITVGSKAALPAALLGKRVIANPSTMLRGISSPSVAAIDQAAPLMPVEAGRLLAFLSHRYTAASADLFQNNGAWLRHLEAMRSADSIDDYLLDPTEWEPAALQKMFGKLGTA